MSDKAPTLKDLMEKGEGVLTKRGNVWTYPGCANDTSGTNLVMPLEYVSDAEVQKALQDGELSAAVLTPAGVATSVRLFDENAKVLSSALAGSPEMGTELPPNSRVESDAGAVPDKVADVEKRAADAMEAAHRPAQPSASAPAAKAKAGRG